MVTSNEEPKKRKKRRGITDKQLKYMFLMPCIVLLAFLIMYPLIWSAYLSFTDYRAIQGRFRLFPGLVEEKPGVKQIKPNPVGFTNYKNILRDSYIWPCPDDAFTCSRGPVLELHA
jgi:ABC-type sugar transport system permease subunit